MDWRHVPVWLNRAWRSGDGAGALDEQAAHLVAVVVVAGEALVIVWVGRMNALRP